MIKINKLVSALLITSNLLVTVSHAETKKLISGKVKKMNIKKEVFGKTEDGKEVDIYTLTNSNGIEVKITNYGGIITSLKVPAHNKTLTDIVLGYDNLNDYIQNNPYFGAIIGRYANRIAKGKFFLNGKEYNLAVNNGVNHLHGGIKGFDKVLWEAKPIKSNDSINLDLKYLSKDMEEGYPGNLNVEVVYSFNNKNELKITYSAKTDKDTIVNLTNHSYFNLDGAGTGDILSHKLMLNADRFTPVDSTLITTGELKSVKDTPMDFTTPTEIGLRINKDDEQLNYAKGYDHNWVLNKKGNELSHAATVYSPKTGIVLDVSTTEPGLQFYSGNFLDGTNIGKGKKIYNFRNGFCLETQHYPDSPNKENFPSVILKPGESYSQTTIYKFSAK